MVSSAKALITNKEAFERFKELANNNPGKYVIVTEEGEGFVLDSDEALTRVLKEKGLKALYFAHEPPKDLKYFVY